jgi:hypothetical protein
MSIVADRVLLVGGPYDGVITGFAMAGCLCVHDPGGTRGDALYEYNLCPDLRTGDIHITSARYVGPGPGRPAEERQNENATKPT